MSSSSPFLVSWSLIVGVVLCVFVAPSPNQAHMQAFCLSVYDDFTPNTCNRALLWIATYDHGARQGQTIPGNVVVSVGGNNYVTPDQSSQSPYPFAKFCLYNMDRTVTIDQIKAEMTSPQFLQSCPAGSQSSLAPQLAQGVNQTKDKFQLRCSTSIWDRTSGNIQLTDDATFAPNCGQALTIRQWAFVELEGLDTTTGGQDITIAMQGVDENFSPDGYGACQAPQTSSTTGTDLFNNNFFNSRLLNVKPDQIYVPGCGKPCGPYKTIPNATHDCTNSSVSSGTNCNVRCKDGKTAAGSYVICNGGSYTGEMICTDKPTVSPNCTRGKCDGVQIPGDDTVVGLPGCGDRVISGTCCDISCASAQQKFSLGYVCANGSSFVAQNGTKCDTCQQGTCLAVVFDKHANEIGPNEPDTSLDDVITSDGTVCVSGVNLNPIRDKIILIARERGTNPKCSTATSAVGNAFLHCNSTSTACGGSPSNTLYVCGGATELPEYGKVCVCDADDRGGCPDVVGKYVVDGPITRSFTRSPTLAPTTMPTWSPYPAAIFPRSSEPHHPEDGAFTGWLKVLQYPTNEYQKAMFSFVTHQWQKYEWYDVRSVRDVKLPNGAPNPEYTNVYFDFDGEVLHMLSDQVSTFTPLWESQQSSMTVECWTGGGSETHDFIFRGKTAGEGVVRSNGRGGTPISRSNFSELVGMSFQSSVGEVDPHMIVEVSVPAKEGGFGVYVGSNPPYRFLGVATSRGISVEAVGEDEFNEAKDALPPKGFCVAGNEAPGCVPLPPVSDGANVNDGYEKDMGKTIENPASKFKHVQDGAFTDFSNTSLRDGDMYEWKGVRPAKGRFTNVYFDFVAPEPVVVNGSRTSTPTRGELYILNDWRYNDRGPVKTNCYNLFKVYTGNNEAWQVKVFGDASVEVILNGRFLNFSDPLDLLAQEIFASGAAGFGISPLDGEREHSIFELALRAYPGRFAVEFHDPGPRYVCDVLETEPTRHVGVAKSGGGSVTTTTTKPMFDKIAKTIVDGKDEEGGVDDFFWGLDMNDFCQPGVNEWPGCEPVPPIPSDAKTNPGFEDEMKKMIPNQPTTYPHTIDGAFTDFNASLPVNEQGDWEWKGIRPAVGRFTNAYFDFVKDVDDPSRGHLYLLNDWKYNSELPVQPHCYNLFRVHTGNRETWQIKVFGDKTVEVILNGVLLNFSDTNDTLAMKHFSAGAVGFELSPMVPNVRHSVFELMITASAGRFAVEFHDPGPRFACDIIETEPAKFTGVLKRDEGGSDMTTVDSDTYAAVVEGIENGTLSDYCQPGQEQFGCETLPPVADEDIVNPGFEEKYNLSVVMPPNDYTDEFVVDGQFTGYDPLVPVADQNFEWKNTTPVEGKFTNVYFDYAGVVELELGLGEESRGGGRRQRQLLTKTDLSVDGTSTSATSTAGATSTQTIPGPVGASQTGVQVSNGDGVLRIINDWVLGNNANFTKTGFSYTRLFLANGDAWSITLFNDQTIPPILVLNGQLLDSSSPDFQRVKVTAGVGVSPRSPNVPHTIYEIDVMSPPGRFALEVIAPQPPMPGSDETLVVTEPARFTGELQGDGGMTVATVDQPTFDNIVDILRLMGKGLYFGDSNMLPGGKGFTTSTTTTTSSSTTTVDECAVCERGVAEGGCGYPSKAETSASNADHELGASGVYVIVPLVIVICILIILVLILICCPAVWCCGGGGGGGGGGSGGTKQAPDNKMTFPIQPSVDDDEQFSGFDDSGYLDVDAKQV